MTLKTVGILSPGDMGHAVGQMLGSHGLRVVTCLEGRSARTRALAKKADMADVGTYQALVGECELILSIMVPAQAEVAAKRVAEAIAETGAEVVYADCNAIAPDTVIRIGEAITAAGGHFVDASIIGGPPRQPHSTRFYVSGPDAHVFAALSAYGLKTVTLGEEIGQASAIKMCYAALTKGLSALCTELLTAAEVLGVGEALKHEFQSSQAALYERMERGVPYMPAKARRWVGEMEEISHTFGSVGLTPKIHAGAADVFRFVGGTQLAERTPEDPPPPPLEETVATLARHLKGQR